MKTFKVFLEEAYIILERRKQRDDSYGFDRTPHKDLEVDYDRPRGKGPAPHEQGYTAIVHKPSNIRYEIDHRHPQNERTDKYSQMFSNLKGSAQKMHGHKPEHSVRFHIRGNADPSKMSKAEKMRVARNAEKVYKQHIASRIPSGHLVSNEPDVNYGEERRNPDRNTRAELYQRRAKFGKVSQRSGKQYSVKIGKRFHPVNDDDD